MNVTGLNRSFASVQRLAILLLCAYSAGGYATTYTNFAQISVSGVYQQGPVCSSGVVADSLASCSFSGALLPNQGGADLLASGSAYGDASGLHAFASEQTSASFFYPSYSVQTTAQVNLQDWLDHFTYPDPFYVYETITTDGYTANPDSYGYTQIDIGDQTTFIDECYFFGAGSCTVSGLVIPSLGFGMSIDLFAEAIIAGAGSAAANFANTAYVSSLAFTDVNGIPLDLFYTTASGLTYPMSRPIGSVPEPATILLLSVALAGFVFSRYCWGGRATESPQEA